MIPLEADEILVDGVVIISDEVVITFGRIVIVLE